MAHIRKYKRFLAIGCSHGDLVDKHAFEAVMKFRRIFKPETRIHLGDLCDFAAFRTGAGGTHDEATALAPDIAAGARLIREYEPTDLLIGNHDVRVWKMARSKNAIMATAAIALRNEFLTACNQAKVKRVVDRYYIGDSWITLGDTKFLHGFMYGENALRDHAEHFGKCVIAHKHTAGVVGGRRSDNPSCYCVGTLANVPMMEYAGTRRATATWSHGFVYGEYSDKECHICLSQAPQCQAGSWHLPL